MSISPVDPLIAHANAFLLGGEPMPDWRTLAGFETVEEVSMGLFWNRSLHFDTPAAWACWLLENGVNQARLFYHAGPPHTLLPAGIETRSQKGHMLWKTHSTQLRPTDPDLPRISLWTYRWEARGEDLDPAIPRLAGTLEEAESTLRTSLQELIALCQLNELPKWAEHYQAKVQVLDGNTPWAPSGRTVFPARGYSLRAQRLYYAVHEGGEFVEGRSFWRDEGYGKGLTQDEIVGISRRYSLATWLAAIVALDSYSAPGAS